jgi:hypothetical protein
MTSRERRNIEVCIDVQVVANVKTSKREKPRIILTFNQQTKQAAQKKERTTRIKKRLSLFILGLSLLNDKKLVRSCE